MFKAKHDFTEIKKKKKIQPGIRTARFEVQPALLLDS